VFIIAGQNLLIGFDLGNEYTQLSYYDETLFEPRSISWKEGKEEYLIPTVLTAKKDLQQWYYGEDAITLAQEEQVPLLYDFINGLAKYEKRPQDMTGSPKTLEYWLFKKKIATAVIAQYDGKNVGYAIYYPVFGSFSANGNVHLEDLFINPEFRHQGLGKKFFFEFVKMIQKDGYNKMEWSCLDWNTPSIEFYKKIGASQESGRVYFDYNPKN